jgi:hypothetical protein
MTLIPVCENSKINIESNFQWLISYTDCFSDSDINSLLQTYIAIVICHDIDEKKFKKSTQILESLLSKLSGFSEQEICSSNTIFLALAAIASYRLFGIQFPAILNHIQKVVDKLPAKLINDSPSMRPIIFLASTLDLIPTPSFNTIDYRPDLFSLLNTDNLSVQKTASELENLTIYGTKKISVSYGIVDIFEVILYEYLQEYNLEVGLRLLRILNHLNISTKPGIHKAFCFVNNQQNPDGSFGFSELEIKKMRAEFQFNNLETWYKLQTTFSYLWLVVEITKSDYRLFRDIATARPIP